MPPKGQPKNSSAKLNKYAKFVKFSLAHRKCVNVRNLASVVKSGIAIANEDRGGDEFYDHVWRLADGLVAELDLLRQHVEEPKPAAAKKRKSHVVDESDDEDEQAKSQPNAKKPKRDAEKGSGKAAGKANANTATKMDRKDDGKTSGQDARAKATPKGGPEKEKSPERRFRQGRITKKLVTVPTKSTAVKKATAAGKNGGQADTPRRSSRVSPELSK